MLGEINRLLRISEARGALIVYAFARKEAVHKLQSARIIPLRAPVSLPDL